MKTDARMNTLAAIVRDDTALVHCHYEKSHSKQVYTFLATKELAETLAPGDFVVTNTGHNYSVVKVVGVTTNINLDPDDEIDYKWVIQKVDVEALEKQLAIQEKIVERLKNRRQRSVREQALAALGIDNPQQFLADLKDS